ncbi:hypothetical protein RFI_14894 [Reticulomyxa filosa]|uniref:DNA polymerase epsilon catalytic subunit n=1 Tax=Reticulomyxa filosa TaxID=46433 RepID=X6N8S9_RETFI|nr:hypothetical protein RFI_14894 [Reticulomyxa filosa]|eukprot:ETO22308.1 hypothetical protein RFI_14894 [Reticulomyxa filosa]
MYYHIPIGNITSDMRISITNLFFFKYLTDYKFVWWIGESNRPDLVGLDEDNNLYENEQSNTVINAKCAYWSICVKLHICYLIITTVVQSEHIQSIQLDAHDFMQYWLNNTDDNAAAENII